MDQSIPDDRRNTPLPELWADTDRRVAVVASSQTWRPPELARPVGVVAGGFDLLHVGHVSLTLAAAEISASVVAVVFDDDSLRRRKGPSRPILPDKERARMCASLRSVDLTVLASSDALATIIDRLDAERFFLNEHSWYTESQLNLFRASTELVFLSRQSGQSTSDISNTISGGV